MSDTATQKCSQCQQVKDLTTANFGIKSDSPTGFRAVCKVCFNDSRSTKQTKEAEALKNHARILQAAKAKLAHPEQLSVGEIHKLENVIRLADKHQSKLAEKVEAQKQAAEHAKKIVATSPSLERIRKIFYCSPFAQSHSDLAQMVIEMRDTVPSLADDDSEMARDYLTKLIASVEEWITDQAEREAESTEYQQSVIDGQACQDAADAIRSKFAGLFGEGVATQNQDKLKALFQMVRESAQAQHKTIKPDEVTATGANRKKISSRILEELTAIQSRLGKAGTEIGPQQTLENVQSLELGRVVGGIQMRRYVQSLVEKLERERATLSPKDYEAKYLSLPAAPKEETIVWRAQINGKELWFFGDGRAVRKGVDVATSDLIKDPVHGWCLAPEPASVAFDDKPVGPLECYQDEFDCDSEVYPKFKYRPANSGGEFAQQRDGSWRKVSSESPWDKPTKVTFKLATPPATPEHTEFRDGFFWTPDEVAKVEHGPMLDKPPVILPPLTRTRADSVATEPNRPNPKDNIEPNRWTRHVAREKFKKEQEAAMLRGVFVWNENQVTKISR
jgi:hypothetical protein